MATFLPLGTGFYQATNPRNPKDINITTLLASAVSDATARAARAAHDARSPQPQQDLLQYRPA